MAIKRNNEIIKPNENNDFIYLDMLIDEYFGIKTFKEFDDKKILIQITLITYQYHISF